MEENNSTQYVDSKNDKSVFLKAIEVVVANPQDIKNESLSLLKKIKSKNPTKTDQAIRKKAVAKIISNYSYYSAFSGGATALTGVVPGIGTAISMIGGASTDAIVCMKFQIEMVMAIATIYEHDILTEESKRLCFMIAGLGAMSEAAKVSGKRVGSKAFISIIKTNLKGPLLYTVKDIFKKVGITFSRKALEKSIPFGVGVVVGFSANKGITWYIGGKAKDYFEYDMGHSNTDG